MQSQPIQSNFFGSVLNDTNQLSNLFQGDRILKPEVSLPEPTPEPEPVQQPAAPAYEPEEEKTVTLSDGQLKSMAKRKARTWGAFMNMLFFLIEVFNSWGMVRKDDERLVEDRESVLSAYELANDIEYQAAKKRVSDFEQFLIEAQENSQLDEMEMETLEEAFLAELRWKNKRGELDTEGVMTIVAGMFVSRIFKKAGSFSKSFWKKIAVR